MLFNSHVFIFLFLPVCLAGYYFLGRKHKMESAFSWLVLCSFFFYGWWNPAYLILIIGSILFNYMMGGLLVRESPMRKTFLIAGIAINLGLLGYYKYANFFIDRPATEHRVLFWQARQVGATGFLYWCACWWQGLPTPGADGTADGDLLAA